MILGKIMNAGASVDDSAGHRSRNSPCLSRPLWFDRAAPIDETLTNVSHFL